MRITNGMIINNSLNHINLNKRNLDKLATQQGTEKKIQKPSEDPIVAVRALRFRSQLAELEQYLTKNIPDARSWLELTEDALDGVSRQLSDMQTYLVQASTDSNETVDRANIIKTLEGFRDQIYQEANSDVGGRRIFSGYKTDTDMTFVYSQDVRYDITEKFSVKDFDTITKVFNSVDITDVDTIAPADAPVSKTDIHRIRFAYDELSTTVPGKEIALKVYNEDGTENEDALDGLTVKTVAAGPDGKYYEVGADGSVTATEVKNPYQPEDKEIYILADTGEAIFGDDAYAQVKKKAADGEIRVDYTKAEFKKGDLRPEHFFDCQAYDENGDILDFKYETGDEDINYTVNFNQKLKVNSEGKNLFTHDIIRDTDELINLVSYTKNLEDKVKDIKNMMAESRYSGEEDQKKLASMLEAAEKELDLADDAMQKRFEQSITLFKEHQAVIDAEVADIGSRDKRLTLNETRLTSQSTNLKELKSTNEDVDLPEVIINLAAAQMVYDASLSATSKIITKSLLDYL